MIRHLAIAFATALPLAFPGPAHAQNPARDRMQFDGECPPPTKFAAGACVQQCPAGYEDRGRVCFYRSISGGGN